MTIEELNNAVEAAVASFESHNRLYVLRIHLEEYLAGRPYQFMAIYQRCRHRRERGENWPDKPVSASVVSRYPNILAELDASGWWLDRIAGFAQVSMEVMAAVMEDNAELTWNEMKGLTRCFGCKMEYLAAPVLSMIDPTTNKGRMRLRHLKDLVQQTEGMDRFLYQLHSGDVLPKLESGRPVTYAAYRWACYNLQEVLDVKAQKEARQRNTRMGEIPAAQSQGKAQMNLRTRLRQARERCKAREIEERLARIRKYVDDTKAEIDGGSTIKDLNALADFSRRDFFSALLLAIMYGQAQGYRAVQEAVV